MVIKLAGVLRSFVLGDWLSVLSVILLIWNSATIRQSLEQI